MTASKSRVLFVGAFPPEGKSIFGGMVTSCRALAGSSFGTQFELILVDSTQLSNPPPKIILRSLLALRRFIIFVWQFENRRPDAVLLFAAIGASIIEKGAMCWYARLRRTPSLIFLRGGQLITSCAESRFTRLWTKLAIGGSSRILCQGPAWQRFATEVLRFPANAAPIIPNWTASDSMLAIGAARSEPVVTTRLLFVGWLDREKGVMELLSACKQLLATRRFILDLVGEGNVSSDARSFVANAGLEGNVRFHGWLSGVALEQRYGDAQIFVLPSWAEGLPNAMIEAMAAKLAVVVTRVGNIPDVIEHGVDGVLVMPHDVCGLSQELGKLLDDPASLKAIASAGHEKARATFSIGPAVERLTNAIRDVQTSKPRKLRKQILK